MSSLAKLVASIKSTTKAKRSLSETLKKIIEDYHNTLEFDQYMLDHAEDALKYLKPHEAQRLGIFRASSAGACLQKQVFTAVAGKLEEHGLEPDALMKTSVTRKPQHLRALYNGTFVHVRWHMVFDALHEKGLVRTIEAEARRFYPALSLSGTCDRVIELEYDGETVRAVVDMKSIKDEYYTKLIEPKLDHAKQQHVYGLFDFGATRWIMLYEDKNTHELKIYDREYDPELFAELHREYRLATQWVGAFLAGNTKQLPKLPLETSWCNWCEWKGVCLQYNPDRDKAVM